MSTRVPSRLDYLPEESLAQFVCVADPVVQGLDVGRHRVVSRVAGRDKIQNMLARPHGH